MKTGEKMGINVGKGTDKTVFTEDYLVAGQTFGGYVLLSDVELADHMIQCMNMQAVYLGSNKSSGYGKCNFTIRQTQRNSYQKYAKKNDANKEVYMMLLSDLALINEEGEICSLEQGLAYIQKKLGVANLQIIGSATAIHKNSGINHTWGLRTPEIPMYQAGSVFKLAYEGGVTVKVMRALEMEGLGVRRNEGCGRVLFVDFIPEIKKKVFGAVVSDEPEGIKIKQNHEADTEVITIVAKRFYQNKFSRLMDQYIVDNPLPEFSVAESQLGHLLSLCAMLKYHPDEGVHEIKNYIVNAVSKDERNRKHKNKPTRHLLSDFVDVFFQKRLEEILKIPEQSQIKWLGKKLFLSEQEQTSIKLDLLEKMFRYYGRRKKIE